MAKFFVLTFLWILITQLHFCSKLFALLNHKIIYIIKNNIIIKKYNISKNYSILP